MRAAEPHSPGRAHRFTLLAIVLATVFFAGCLENRSAPVGESSPVTTSVIETEKDRHFASTLELHLKQARIAGIHDLGSINCAELTSDSPYTIHVQNGSAVATWSSEGYGTERLHLFVANWTEVQGSPGSSTSPAAVSFGEFMRDGASPGPDSSGRPRGHIIGIDVVEREALAYNLKVSLSLDFYYDSPSPIRATTVPCAR